MAQQQIEGTWEEIKQHEAEFRGKRFRLVELMPEPQAKAVPPLQSTPNLKAMAAMQEIAERQKDRPFAEGSDIVNLVRDARAGAMYGYAPAE